ncbi:hypothetical protein MtrunA17_Chr3g0110391 [Medicago truncatula]|uniref:Uncharacterized protein n=1 Tax=Medicago truncatula TaxID=3880 RepID=A0A396IVV1_MEDTR|nr:hypothetical protein MtrunA17_Chr3g0110391 [Medicago truncatula]
MIRQTRGTGSNSTAVAGGHVALSSAPMYVQRFQSQRAQPRTRTHSAPHATDIIS